MLLSVFTSSCPDVHRSVQKLHVLLFLRSSVHFSGPSSTSFLFFLFKKKSLSEKLGGLPSVWQSLSGFVCGTLGLPRSRTSPLSPNHSFQWPPPCPRLPQTSPVTDEKEGSVERELFQDHKPSQKKIKFQLGANGADMAAAKPRLAAVCRW